MNVLTVFTFLIQTVMCKYDKRIITTLKYSKYTITPTIVNGKPASEGQFPFLVSIKEPAHKLEPGKTVWRNICGGSIIGETKVLSAAHCFESDDFYYTKQPDPLRVVAGNLGTTLIHTGRTETTADAQWRRINKVILHGNFNFPACDIAIAMIDLPWVYNKKVNVVKLATVASDYQGQCVSAGYGSVGYNKEYRTSPVMLSASIVTIPSWRCSLLWEMNMNPYICTSSAVTDVAMGDSGGPLVCMRTGDPEEVDNGGILAGVVSGKNLDKTTLYTRVSAYKDWIAKDGTGNILSPRRTKPTQNGSANKLRVSMNVCLSITLFVLIYLLFYCLVSSGTMHCAFVKVGSSFRTLLLCA